MIEIAAFVAVVVEAGQVMFTSFAIGGEFGIR